jgi:uncharacterized protein
VTAYYLDASAIVKLAVAEPETDAVRTWVEGLPPETVLVTCEVAVAEVLRAVDRSGGDPEAALAHLDTLDHVVVDRNLVLAAGRLGPATLRTLDALHLAAASALGDELGALVTYDTRQAEAAAALGLPTFAPGG